MEIAMYIIWAAVLVLGVVIEMASVQQIGWAAAIGALGALITHAITKGDPLWVEFAVFGICWIISWGILFALIKPKLKQMHDKEDGFMRYIDSEAIVTKPNSSKTFGEIKIDGKNFRFKSEDIFKKDDVAIVKEFKGVTAMVAKKG